MTEFQIISQFNSFLISNALYLLVFTFLLFMAFGGVYRMYQDGATIVGKILATLFSITVVYFNCLTLGFLYAQQEGVAYSLAQLDEISESSQAIVDFFWWWIFGCIFFNTSRSDGNYIYYSCFNKFDSSNLDCTRTKRIKLC